MNRLRTQGVTIKIDIDPDFTGAKAKLSAGIKAIEATAPSIEIETNVDTDTLQRTFGSALRRLQGAGGQLNMGSIFNELNAGAQAAQQALQGVTQQLGPLTSAGGSATSVMGGLGSSMGSVSAASIVLIPLIGALTAGVGVLIGVAGALIGALAAIPSIIAAVVQALAVLFIALAPVFAAFSAFRKDQGKISTGGGGGGGAGNAVKNAARQQEIAARRVRDAQEALQDAYQQAAQGAEDAAERIQLAEERLIEAQQDATKNQERLNKAREDARERVENLRISLSRLIINEDRAADNLEEARKVYERTLVNPFADAEDQSDALLAVKEAEQDLAEVQADRQDVAKDLADVERDGIDSTEEVQRALEDNRRANEFLIDSEKALGDAREASAEQQEQAARSIRNAQENLQDAFSDSQRAADNFGAALSGAGGGLSDFQSQLMKLSPAAKEFTEFLIEMWEALQPILLGVQDRVFQGLVDTLRPLAMVYLPIISEILFATADVLNQWVKDFAALALNPDFVRAIQSIGRSNVRIIEELGQAFLNLTEFFVNFMEVAAPFAEWLAGRFTDFTSKLNEVMKSPEGKAGLTEFLESIKPTLDALGDFSWEFLKELFDLIKELQPATTQFLQAFTDALPELTELLKQVLPPMISLAAIIVEQLSPYLDDFGRIVVIVVQAIAAVIAMFDSLGQTLGFILGPIISFGRAVWDHINNPMEVAISIIQLLGRVAQAIISSITSMFVGAWNFIYNTFIGPWINFFGAAAGVLDRAGGAVASFVHIAINFFSILINFIEDNFNRIFGPINSLITKLGSVSSLGRGIFGIGGGALGALLGGQTGGRITQGGLIKVGERGEEVVALPRGAQIFSNDAVRGLAANMTSFTRSSNMDALVSGDGSGGGPLIGTLVMPPNSSVEATVAAFDHYRRAKMGIRR